MKQLLTLMLLTALLAACDTVKAPAGATRDPLDPKDYPKVVALEGLGQWLSHGQAIIQGSQDAPLTVTVPIRMRHDNETHAQYRFIFFDIKHIPLRPEMDWQYVELPGRTEVIIQGTALDSRAVDWRCEVRPAK